MNTAADIETEKRNEMARKNDNMSASACNEIAEWRFMFQLNSTELENWKSQIAGHRCPMIYTVRLV